jgi:hypothetical protein
MSKKIPKGELIEVNPNPQRMNKEVGSVEVAFKNRQASV